MTTRRALGKGLSALIGDTEVVPDAGEDLRQIPVTLVDPNPSQPRRRFSKPRLAELAASIRASGVVQPVLLRKTGERYQLVAGERRWRAAALAGLDTLPAVVRDLSDKEALELALTENLLREDLSSLEVARAYETLQQQFEYTHQQIAERLGIDRSTVSNTLRLLRLPADVKTLLNESSISPGHARALLACPDQNAQLDLARAIVRDGLTVRQAERIAAKASDPEPKAATATAAGAALDANIKAAVRELERALGTRVRINGDEQRGRIEISYYSGQDLNRLYDWLVRN